MSNYRKKKDSLGFVEVRAGAYREEQIAEILDPQRMTEPQYPGLAADREGGPAVYRLPKR